MLPAVVCTVCCGLCPGILRYARILFVASFDSKHNISLESLSHPFCRVIWSFIFHMKQEGQVFLSEVILISRTYNYLDRDLCLHTTVVSSHLSPQDQRRNNEPTYIKAIFFLKDLFILFQKERERAHLWWGEGQSEEENLKKTPR